MRKFTISIAVLMLLLGLSGFAVADSFGVLVNTSGLPGAQPFTLDFYLSDGSGTMDNNTSLTISNFNLGGGTLSGSPTLTGGGASGDTSAGVTLSDSDFFNEFQQIFNPGSFLSFQVSFNGGVDAGGTPDLFAFLIDELNTNDPSTANSLLTLSFDSAHPGANVYSATTFVTGGNAVRGVTPVITPEPGSMLLLGSGLGMMLAARRRRSALVN